MVPHIETSFYHWLILIIKNNKRPIISKLIEGLLLSLLLRLSKSIGGQVQAPPPAFLSNLNVVNQNFEIGQIPLVKTAETVSLKDFFVSNHVV